MGIYKRCNYARQALSPFITSLHQQLPFSAGALRRRFAAPLRHYQPVRLVKQQILNAFIYRALQFSLVPRKDMRMLFSPASTYIQSIILYTQLAICASIDINARSNSLQYYNIAIFSRRCREI